MSLTLARRCQIFRSVASNASFQAIHHTDSHYFQLIRRSSLQPKSFHTLTVFRSNVKPPKVKDITATLKEKNVDVQKLVDIEGWKELWSDDIAPWHKDFVNPKLVQNLDATIAESKKSDPKSICFFVPLCGKSVDLKFLYDAGFSVIGCEGVEKACQEFFLEHKIEYRRTETHHGMQVFESKDSRLKIICGDFYGLNQAILGGPVDCVWDRGSFVAIDVAQRDKYTKTIIKLLNDDFGYLLVSIEREFELPNMMPHSVSLSDVRNFFGNTCSVKLLEQIHDPGSDGSGYTKENAFLITRLAKN